MNIKSYIFSIFDVILLKERCQVCGKFSNYLCNSCLNNFQRPERDLPNYIFALYEYRNEAIKKILTDAKYRKRFAGLRAFSEVLYDTALEIVNEKTELNNFSKIILIPVPISRKRFKNRGFNQTEIIAKSILEHDKEKTFSLENKCIIKIKDKTPQASIKSRSERLKSPEGTFKIINKELIKDSLCIIIDDITTTGGTIKEVRRILLESGARDAVGLTIAH